MEQDPACHFLPANGLPDLPKNRNLPEDLYYFYSRCGGLECFIDGNGFDYPFRILSPRDFIQSHIRCIKNLSNEELQLHLGSEHFSWDWYVFADFDWGGEECVAITLNPEDLGSCYDCSRWEIYPSKDTLWTISFTNFLGSLYYARGKIWRDDIFNY